LDYTYTLKLSVNNLILSKAGVFLWRNGMKTRKTAFLALIALAISGGLIFYGCDWIFQDEPTPTDITFTVTANTPTDKNTESLDIRFSEAVTGLTTNDISLSASNVTKGSLSGSGANYNLTVTVSGFGGSYPCTVTVHKTGVTSSAQSVGGGVINNEGKANFSLNPVGNVNNGSAKVAITLTKDVTLNTDQITITDGQGTPSGLTTVNNSKKSYELTLAGAKAGTIKIKIENSQVTNEERDVTLESASIPTPGTIPITSINIRDVSNADKVYVGAEWEVEIGKPKQLEAIIAPTDASNRILTWDSVNKDIAKVDSTGLVTGLAEGTAFIIVTSNDGSGIGKITPVYVKKRVFPDEISLNLVDTKTETNTKYHTATTVTKGTAIEGTNNTKNLNWTLGNNFYVGDEYTIETELKLSNRINDQSVIQHIISGGDVVTVEDLGLKAPSDDNPPYVPLHRYRIKTSAKDGDAVIRFESNYMPVNSAQEVYAELKVTVDYTEPSFTSSTMTFKQGSNTLTPDSDAVVKPSQGSEFTLTITPNVPCKNVTVICNTAGQPSNAVGIEGAMYQWKMKMNWWTAKIVVTLTDYKNKSVTNTYTIDWQTTP
jgi:hypothetical protein